MEPLVSKQRIEDDDRISQLPDPILHLILSHVETRDALPLMFLSKRWKNLWASMPYFDIFYEDHHEEEIEPMFAHFVNSLLLLRGPFYIHSFCLKFVPGGGLFWYGGLEQQHISTWAEHLVSRGVKILGFSVLIREAVKLPSCLFTCRSLEDLKLESFRSSLIFNPPEHTELVRLRKLNMGNIIADCDSLKILISGCPVLENLDLDQCKLDGLDISSNTIKKLRISGCKITDSMVRISCPSLQRIHFLHNHIKRVLVCLGNLSSVVKASFQVDSVYVTNGNPKPLKYVNSEIKEKWEDMQSETFCCLRKLTLTGENMTENFNAASYFLDRSPKLELLTIFGKDVPPEGCIHFYSCPHFKLKTEFKCGEENYSVIEMVEESLLRKCGCHSRLFSRLF